MGNVPKEVMVYKSSELIEARYRMTSTAQKIAATVIGRVDPTGKEPLPQFKMTLPELVELSGIPREVINRSIGKYTKELKAIVVELRAHDGISYIQLGLFRKFQFEKDKILHIQFEEELERHIRDFSGNFTKYQLAQLQDLNSGFAVRLYEILRKAHNMSKPETSVTFYEKSIEDLRAMLGVKPGAYDGRFDLFRRNVIEKPQKELEEKTDLKFDFEPIRHGRKIGAIKFIVRHNYNFQPSQDEVIEGEVIPKVSQEQFNQLRTAVPAFSEKEAGYLVANFEKEQLAATGLAYMQAVMSGTKIEKPGPYFLAILRNQRREDEHWKSQQPTHFTTEEMLDTSWADDFQFQFEDDV